MKLEILNNDIKDAMRARNKYALGILKTFKGELELKAKSAQVEVDDLYFDKLIVGYTGKMRKALKDKKFAKKYDYLKEVKEELKVLDKYLPVMLLEPQIREVANVILATLRKELGDDKKAISKSFMKKVKEHCGVYADGKLLSDVVRGIEV